MSFLRQFEDAQPDTKEWREKQVVENVIGVLATSPDGKSLWYHNKPCPLDLLPQLYAKYVSRWDVASDIMVAIRESGVNANLEEWLSSFNFFKIVDCADGVGLIYSPIVTDVMVECYYKKHKFSVCFQDITPTLYWNKCPACGHVNTHEQFKYSIICSTTGELVSKWCAYFHKKDIVVPDREVCGYICRHCASCHYIDCPYSWGIAENNGNGKNKSKMISFLLPQDAMCRYARFANMPEFLETLASVSEEEFWGDKFYCLRTYIYLTFYFQLIRRNQHGGLIEANNYSWFNTGLLTRDTCEDIFVCFKPNANGREYVGLTWKNAPNGLYNEFRGNRDGEMIPEYVPPYENMTELFWGKDSCGVNLTLNWGENFEHIYFHNLNRILTCKSFRNGLSGVCIPPKYKEKIEKNYDIKLPTDPRSVEKEKSSEFYKAVWDLFARSVNLAEKKLRNNYKWVLPIYFPRNRSMSLALPLFLNREGKTREPDLALVCTRRKDGELEYYDARTILSGHMIYQNARQVCKPFVEWVSGLLEDDFVGRVTSIKGKGGYIKSDSGMPLQFSMIDNPSVAGILSVGDRVRFEFCRKGKGWVAINVRLSQHGNGSNDRSLHNGNQNSSIEQPSYSAGRVKRIGPCYGFIQSEERNTIYFSRGANRNVFDRLTIGDRVFFDCTKYDNGYVASNIVIDQEDANSSGDYSSPEAKKRLRSKPQYLDDYLEDTR